MSVYAQDYGYFFNSNSNDRTYNADSFETWLKPFFVSGVFTGCLQVQAQSTPDMTVKVTKGYANLDGKAAYWPSDNTLTIETASGVYDRIDTIVLRRDNTNRRVSLEVVKGTASATPSPTAPTRNTDTYELVLAEVLVGTGVTEIAGSAITDKRPDTDVCGYVVAAVQTPDFSELYAQFAAQAEEFMGDQADEFLDWFDEMKDQLSEDAAGHLQQEIDDLDSAKADKVTGGGTENLVKLDENGNLVDSGYKPTSFMDAETVASMDFTNTFTTPWIFLKDYVYTRNRRAYKVLRVIPSGTAFSSLTSSDVAEMRLAEDVASLNSKFPTAFTVPTLTNATVNWGGYFRIGDVVFINMRITMTATSTTIGSLPAPKDASSFSGSSVVAFGSSVSLSKVILMLGNGTLISDSSIASGTTIVLAGSYLAEPVN